MLDAHAARQLSNHPARRLGDRDIGAQSHYVSNYSISACRHARLVWLGHLYQRGDLWSASSNFEPVGKLETVKTGNMAFGLTLCVDNLGNRCNTIGNAEGIIEVHGNWTLVFDSLSPLGAALLLKIEPEPKIVCHDFGKQEDRKYWTGGGTEATASGPLVSIEGKPYEAATFSSEVNEMDTAKEFEVKA